MQTLRLKDFQGEAPKQLKRKKVTVIEFKNYKPKAYSAGPKRRTPTFEEIFGFSSGRTTGEDVLIIKEWLKRTGKKEIPEWFSFIEFANAIQWQITPRHAWQHFMRKEAQQARRFLKFAADIALLDMKGQ